MTQNPLNKNKNVSPIKNTGTNSQKLNLKHLSLKERGTKKSNFPFALLLSTALFENTNWETKNHF